MFAQAGANFQRVHEAGRTMARDVGMAEAVRHRVAIGENDMPMLHEIIADTLVFG